MLVSIDKTAEQSGAISLTSVKLASHHKHFIHSGWYRAREPSTYPPHLRTCQFVEL